eukprot:Nitzschia sp. Nitz4//scaffold190_size42200//39685//41112//NITZ4_007396-RA/size42200-augustus-gene-0.2-mRNA-1//1//CDS//3329540156//1145//frame0
MRNQLSLLLLAAGLLSPMAWAANYDDAYGDNANGDDANGDDDANAGDDAVQDDDYAFAQKYYYANINSGNSYFSAGDDYIKYWTDYAILPLRCIVQNDVDVIVFSVHEHGHQRCTNSPVGTYVTPVPNFFEGYLKFYEQIQQDMGVDDYELPDTGDFAYCTQTVKNGEEYWLQIGCADGTSQELAVNIYSDNTCTTRSVEDGYDDANIDVSDLQLPFQNCQACVTWVDQADEVDDMYYENRQTDAPLCSTAWNYKATCDRKCQKMGLVKKAKEGWSAPDKVILAILAIFGFGMLVAILRKRQRMSNKDALLEQAAMTAAGLQPAHVVGIFFLIILVVTIFALLQLKNITWAMLLIVNTALFGYLMKLTVDSGVSSGETVIGPDGTIIRHVDSDDSSIESSLPASTKHSNAGTYTLPAIA